VDLRAQPTGRESSLSLSVRGFVFQFQASSAVTYYSTRFTSCYDQDSTQEEIFEQDVRPLIDVVYSGVVRHYIPYEFLLYQ
jgi:kinesin family protein 22